LTLKRPDGVDHGIHALRIHQCGNFVTVPHVCLAILDGWWRRRRCRGHSITLLSQPLGFGSDGVHNSHALLLVSSSDHEDAQRQPFPWLEISQKRACFLAKRPGAA
jgi:hypothetical protein